MVNVYAKRIMWKSEIAAMKYVGEQATALVLYASVTVVID
jgi:hypothetical protein